MRKCVREIVSKSERERRTSVVLRATARDDATRSVSFESKCFTASLIVRTILLPVSPSGIGKTFILLHTSLPLCRATNPALNSSE